MTERRKPFKREPYPSETQDRFLVRFPEGMRAKIAELSKANNRSMNAEIIARLQASLDLSERGTGSNKMTFKIGDDGFAELRRLLQTQQEELVQKIERLAELRDSASQNIASQK